MTKSDEPTEWPPIPADRITDPKRVAALRRAGLLDSPPEAALDAIAASAAAQLGGRVGLVSLIDADRHVIKSSTMAEHPFSPEREIDLSLSLCSHAVAAGAPLLLPDARADARFGGHPAVQGGLVGAYAGVPIFLEDGQPVGTVCVVHDVARDWGPEQVAVLEKLARDAAETVARRNATADARARRSATRAGLTERRGGGPSLEASASSLDMMSAALATPGQAAPGGSAGAEDGLAGATFLFIRQLDAYLANLQTAAESDDSLRLALTTAQAALLRAVEELDRAWADPGAEGAPPRRPELVALRDSVANFLEAERRRDRASLMFRRSMCRMDDVERAVAAAAEAEQAMRLMLHGFVMARG